MEWDLLNLDIWPGIIGWAVGLGIVVWIGMELERKDDE